MVATTDLQLAAELLDALSGVGVRYGMLHRADDLESSSTSDIDIVADQTAVECVRRLRRALAARPAAAVMIWPYDLSAASTFWLTPQGSGVQLDIVCDATGIGKYGFRSSALLERVRRKGLAWVVDPEDSLLYQLRKRMVKGDLGGAQAALTQMNFNESSRARIESVFRPDIAEEVWATVANRELSYTHTSSRRTNVVRLAKRIVRPVGHVVRSPSTCEEVTLAVGSRLARTLPHVSTTGRST